MTPASPTRTTVSAPDAPAAIGPYSQAVRHGEVLYCSGALPLDPATGELVGSSLGAEVRQCLENLQAVCRAAGTELAQALRLTVYTTRLDCFADINDAYGAFFAGSPPARVAIGAAALPKGAKVEIDAIVGLAG